MKNNLETTNWDNQNIYKSITDPKILKDIGLIETAINQIDQNNEIYNDLITDIESNDFSLIDSFFEMTSELNRLYLDTSIILNTLGTYAHTSLSVNTNDHDARDLMSKVNSLSVKMTKAYKPIQIFLLRAPEDFIAKFLKDERNKELSFYLRNERSQNDFLLPVNEEVLVSGFSLDGLTAWGKLYTDIAGVLKVNIDGEMIGIAKASNLLSEGDRAVRETAYRAINDSWRVHEISTCSILNSINGWRNESFHIRSKVRQYHFLDHACHSARIERTTLDALISAAYEKKSIGHDVLKIMADEYKIEKLGPWDLLAPRPVTTVTEKIKFPKAIDIIIEAFNEVDPAMGTFAKMMFDKNWIDATASDHRGSGAYCTGFANVREPRVFITYDGSMKNVVTLAHEIGHAYHSWVMRDLDLVESAYPMTLAETASIFAETVVRNFLIRNSKSNEELKNILWQEMQSAQSLLINIPARFEFEKRFAELRAKKQVSVQETKSLMVDSQKHWYGTSLSEYDDMFWSSKMHFFMSGRSFYNYPYLFGYLFSLGIYAKKAEFGNDFHLRYVDLLRDTGRMTAEELVKKHLKLDIGKKSFWINSISIVEEAVNQYKRI